MNSILVRYGEIALKGRVTRSTFEKRLQTNIKQAMDNNQLNYTVKRIQGRILIETEEIEQGTEIISHIFGVTSCSPAEKIPLDIPLLKEKALAVIIKNARENDSFALRVNRAGTHSFTSQDIAIQVGAYIQGKKHYPVNLTKPDIELFIEIRDQEIYMYTEKIKGPGGMPLKSQGNMISIIENNQDLLSTWYLMKRGCNIIFYITNSTTLQNSYHFFSKWYIQPKVIETNNKIDYIELIAIILRNRCKALCSGLTLSQNTEKTMEKINDLKEKLNIPILTPILSLQIDEIEKQCKEKGIIK